MGNLNKLVLLLINPTASLIHYTQVPNLTTPETAGIDNKAKFH